MEWVRPESLYLILPLALGWLVVSLRSRRLRGRAAEAFAARTLWPKILPIQSTPRFWVKLALRELALVLGLVALAGPRYGIQEELVIPRGSDLYVLLDVSRSMLAEDVPPSRLGRAKADVSALLNRLEGERVGLIAFAGQAVVKCPLTVDYDSFRRSLSELDPGSAPRGGTAIGDAIRKALEVFDANSGRDQAILLITDGDDQQSYPLEAAAVAAERQVAIFSIGLGDSDQGARIPKPGESRSFVEYQGQQVWSKLDGSLLEQLALKTSGIYVPAGTRTYDLGELYVNYLRGRRGDAEDGRTRTRRAERFQIPLALALLALIADLLILPSRSTAGHSRESSPTGSSPRKAASVWKRPGAEVATLLLVLTLSGQSGSATEPAEAVRQGLQHYRQGEFEQAGSKFKTAREVLEKTNPSQGEIAAFDEACAAHRQGDVAQARELYLRAGLSRDRRLAGSAHYNLGTLIAEDARRLAGPSPDEVSPEKRPEILEQLHSAVASFRHCLELQPENQKARRDIELIRQWMKYYGDRWRERDRRQRRKEANLLAFLEFLIQTQQGLHDSVKSLDSPAPADAFAELKRREEELGEEIGPLKEKIRSELQPTVSGGGNTPPAATEELERGIELLLGWADAAGRRIAAASAQLGERRTEPVLSEQQGAIDELEKIWEAVIPFQALLAHDLSEQTTIAAALKPSTSEESLQEGDPSAEADSQSPVNPAIEPSDSRPHPGRPQTAGVEADQSLAPLVVRQERTQRRTQLLQMKAQAELDRLEQTSEADPAESATGEAAGGDTDPDDAAEHPNHSVDPEQVKQWYRQAIELAPQAVIQMDSAIKSLKQVHRDAAYPAAEEARRILEEIQKSQPKNEQQKQDEKDQQQDQPEQNQKDSSRDENQQKGDGQNKEQEQDQQQDRPKSDEQKPNEPESSSTEDRRKREPQQSQGTRDKIEETLRKVRERQDAKRERDRKVKARISGGIPVEKDW